MTAAGYEIAREKMKTSRDERNTDSGENDRENDEDRSSADR